MRLLYHRNLTLADYLRPYREQRLVKCVPFREDPLPFLARAWRVGKQLLGMALKRGVR
jgi:hypothetical protein